MKLLNLRPMFWTEHIQETIDFYTQVLGFTCGARNDDWGWAAMHRDEVEIMIAKPNAHTPFDKPYFSGSIYINVDDVETLWNDLKDKVQICYPVEEFEWGMREFAIYDNNGYLLQFGEDIS
ncbi:MAG: VOC family protein [Chitinophagales bacterium]